MAHLPATRASLVALRSWRTCAGLLQLCFALAVLCRGLVVRACTPRDRLAEPDTQDPTPSLPYALLLCAHAWRLAASARSVLGVPEL